MRSYTILFTPSGFTSNQTEKATVSALFHECYKSSGTNPDVHKWVLKAEYYFRLIEHRELQEARKTAKQSSRNAHLAIIVSIFMSTLSMIVAICVSGSPS